MQVLCQRGVYWNCGTLISGNFGLGKFFVYLRIEWVKEFVHMKELIYPIGIQDFEFIRKMGMVYVDKTDLVYRMVS